MRSCARRCAAPLSRSSTVFSLRRRVLRWHLRVSIGLRIRIGETQSPHRAAAAAALLLLPASLLRTCPRRCVLQSC
jgi:hypothetical protein